MAITQKPEAPAPQPVQKPFNPYAGYAKKAELDDALETAMEQKANRTLAEKLAQKEAQDLATRELVEKEQARRAESIRQQGVKEAMEDPKYAAYMLQKNALQAEQEKEEQNPDSLGSQPMVKKVGDVKGGFSQGGSYVKPIDENQRYVQVGNKLIDRSKNPDVVNREAWDAYNALIGAEKNPQNIGGTKVKPFPWGTIENVQGRTGATLPMYEVQEGKAPEPKPAEKKADAGFNFGEMLKGIGGALGPLAGLVQAYSYGQSGNTTTPLAIDTLAKRRAENEAREQLFEQELKKSGEEWKQRQAELALQLQNAKDVETMQQAGREKLANIGGWYDLERQKMAAGGGAVKPQVPWNQNLDQALRGD